MWVLLGPISNPTVRLPWRSWGTELTGTRPPRSCSRLSARPRGLVRVMIPWGGCQPCASQIGGWRVLWNRVRFSGKRCQGRGRLWGS